MHRHLIRISWWPDSCRVRRDTPLTKQATDLDWLKARAIPDCRSPSKNIAALMDTEVSVKVPDNGLEQRVLYLSRVQCRVAKVKSRSGH